MRWASRLDGLADLGEMIFIQRLYGIFYLTSIKTFVMSLEKDRLDHVVLRGFTFLSIFYNKQWPNAVRNKFRQNFGSFM